MSTFSGKVAIVTGSSNGIGRACAVMFAGEGAKVVVTGRNGADLEAAVAECIAAGASPEHILSLKGNIIDDEFRESLVNKTIETFGKLDILINNHGGVDHEEANVGTPDFMNGGLDNYDYIMNLNLRTIVSLLMKCLPHLEKTNGEVINMSSIAALPMAVPSCPFYAMSKAALSQLTRSLAMQYIRKGVRINAVCPGMVKTKIWQRQGQPDSVIEELEKMVTSNNMVLPCGFVGQSEDIANAVAFLCDRPRSRFIVGHCLVIDGGSSIVNPLLSGNFGEINN